MLLTVELDDELKQQEAELLNIWGPKTDWQERYNSYWIHDQEVRCTKKYLELLYRNGMFREIGIEKLIATDTWEWLKEMSKKYHHAESIRGLPDLHCKPFPEFEFLIDVKTGENLEGIQFFHNIRRDVPVLYAMFTPNDRPMSVWAHQLPQHKEYVGLQFWEKRVPFPNVLTFLQRLFDIELPTVFTRPPPRKASGELCVKIKHEAVRLGTDFLQELNDLPKNWKEIQRQFELCKKDIDRLESSSDQQ